VQNMKSHVAGSPEDKGPPGDGEKINKNCTHKFHLYLAIIIM